MVNKCLYEVLDISEDASEEEIKNSYKRLAKKYHPDVTDLDVQKAEDRFKEISIAYSILSDPSKRKAYDKDKRFGGFNHRPEPAFVWEYQPYSDSYVWSPRRKKQWNEHHDSMYI